MPRPAPLSTPADFSLHPHHEPVLLAAPQPWIPSPHSRRAHPLPWLQSRRRLQITDPLSAQSCSSSVVVPSDAAINHRPPRAHLGSKPVPPAQVGRRDIVWEWLWEWECRRI
ncbi:hypothetical protein M0R45_000991 [Rubus argutus]|uniref:Uncharacterized protein n=1 Tax=Rubus argutus TaxID=59490 RepID=A0AAW1VLD2_RUBAR